jgi:hypothetical protein
VLAGAVRLLFIVNGCFEAARIWEVIAIRSGLFSMKDHQRTETRSTVDDRDREKAGLGWGRWLGGLSFAPSSEVGSIEHDTKQVRRNEGKLSCS